MVLMRKDKEVLVESLTESFQKALSVVLVDSNGVESNDMNKLRADAREQSVELKVAKNSLIRRSLKGSDYECFEEKVKGPNLVAFSYEHPGAAARILKEFKKDNDALEVKALAFDGNFFEGSQLDLLASLPTYDEAIAKLMSVMKEASAGKLVKTLAAIKEQKEV